MAEQGAQGVDVYVAHKQHLELGSVGKTLPVDLPHAIVGHAVKRLPLGGLHARMVAVEYRHERVVVTHLRVGLPVGQERAHTVYRPVESNGVPPGMGEVEIGELQHRFQVFDRRLSGELLRVVADGGGHSGYL